MEAGVQIFGAHAHSAHKACWSAGNVQQAEVLCNLHLRQWDAGLQLWAPPDWRTCRCTATSVMLDVYNILTSHLLAVVQPGLISLERHCWDGSLC